MSIFVPFSGRRRDVAATPICGIRSRRSCPRSGDGRHSPVEAVVVAQEEALPKLGPIRRSVAELGRPAVERDLIRALLLRACRLHPDLGVELPALAADVIP